MRRLAFAASVLFLLVAVPALADNPPGQPFGAGSNLSSAVTPTQDMWFYEQYQRDYRDPAVAVLEKAKFRTAQRQRRLACRNWFGLSNIRPRTNSDPMHFDYSPGWSSNNESNPYQWNAIGRNTVILQSSRPGTLVY